MTFKEGIKTSNKNGITYLLDGSGRIIEFKPWLGDAFSFMYDRIMEKSIFPKKFKGNAADHINILKSEFKDIHLSDIIEFATGSGNAAFFINNDNNYTGIDISSGLMRMAKRRFKNKGFKDARFVICDAVKTPFKDNSFDIALCNLSLNFFSDIKLFATEVARVLKPGGTFYCSIAVSEKKDPDVKIRGTVLSTDELNKIFTEAGFKFKLLQHRNGALAYFRCEVKK